MTEQDYEIMEADTKIDPAVRRAWERMKTDETYE